MTTMKRKSIIEVDELCKAFDPSEVIELCEKFETDEDNDGQIVIYTGVYRHDDGGLHIHPQD